MDATEKLTVYLTSHYKKIDYEFCISFQWINCLAIKRNRLTLIDLENILGIGRVKINNTIKNMVTT